MFGGIEINTIKLIPCIIALGMLVAASAAVDGEEDYWASQPDGDQYGGGYQDGGPHDGGHNDGGYQDGGNHDGGRYDHGYDWLSPGGAYSYTWSTPVYYDYGWYPAQTYYPAYYYPTAYYPSAYYYYDPVAYDVLDPWWAANVYGVGGRTYYYSGSWAWSTHHGGYFF